jgi:hypothetical protein
MEVSASSRNMSDFSRRMRATKGIRVVLVAREATSRELAVPSTACSNAIVRYQGSHQGATSAEV